MSTMNISEYLRYRMNPIGVNAYGFRIEVVSNINHLELTIDMLLLLKLYKFTYTFKYSLPQDASSSDHQEELRYARNLLIGRLLDLECCIHNQNEDWSMYE